MNLPDDAETIFHAARDLSAPARAAYLDEACRGDATLRAGVEVLQVALKVLKPGMDTRKVVARFGLERQALAMMDHPHIAKVLDAGATDGGRPFFAMELVDGCRSTRSATGIA